MKLTGLILQQGSQQRGDRDGADQDPKVIQLQGGYAMVRRNVPKILRCVRYNMEKDPENYYRF